MKKIKKISYSDILSAIVFIPESSCWLINKFRRLLKVIFKLVGKFIFVVF